MFFRILFKSHGGLVKVEFTMEDRGH